MLNFKVIDWCANSINNPDDAVDYFLERDSWNDYSFFTMYHLHLGPNRLNDNKTVYIGSVRILKKGQKELERNLVPQIFTELDNVFCSMASLDYYEAINRLLNAAERRDLLKAMRDIVYNKKIIEEFLDESGFNNSILRYYTLNDETFTVASYYIFDDYNLLSDIKEKITFKLKGLSNNLVVNFASPEGVDYKHIPERIHVIVGRNGCGKSTILYTLCKLLYASSDQRVWLRDKIGSIEPNGIGFTKVICLSYSVFDNFQMPGLSYSDKLQLCEGIEKGEGRFIYCGIRDIAKEIRAKLSAYAKENAEHYLEDRLDENVLKNISLLGKEFSDCLIKIEENAKLKEIKESCFQKLQNEPSLIPVLDELDIIVASKEKDTVCKFFNNLSTGHKFVLHALVHLIFHVQKMSLVVFDEPENHLHPPLLAVMMKAIRYVLNEKSAVMIAATHSPIILQETLSRNITIIRKDGDICSVIDPSVQTFGESYGLITSQIFGLTSSYADYHSVLDSLLKQIEWQVKETNIIKELEKCFDGEISNQAYAYILNKISLKKKM